MIEDIRMKELDKLSNLRVSGNISFKELYNRVFQLGIHEYKPFAVLSYCNSLLKTHYR